MSLSTHQKIDTDFCVYIHRRPDGTPFYVGKGRPRRAEIVKMAVAAPRKVKQVVCRECGEVFDTKSGKALHCSRLCEQRNRRARQKLEGEK